MKGKSIEGYSIWKSDDLLRLKRNGENFGQCFDSQTLSKLWMKNEN